jgi:quinol monooxygenase YgiN
LISFTVRMRFHPDDHDEIERILRELTAASRREPGCVNYVPHFVDGDANTVVIYEQYADEAAVDAHRASTHFAVYAIAGLYQKMLDRTVENLAAIA